MGESRVQTAAPDNGGPASPRHTGHLLSRDAAGPPWRGRSARLGIIRNPKYP